VYYIIKVNKSRKRKLNFIKGTRNDDKKAFRMAWDNISKFDPYLFGRIYVWLI